MALLLELAENNDSRTDLVGGQAGNAEKQRKPRQDISAVTLFALATIFAAHLKSLCIENVLHKASFGCH
jgi:hypothetical protein